MPVQWSKFSEVNERGQSYITRASLERLKSENHQRVLDVELGGNPATVLFLDCPFRVGAKLVDREARQLHRIRISEVPGWRRLQNAPPGVIPKQPNSVPCVFQACSIHEGRSRETLEIVLKCDGREHRAFMVGCPRPLLECVIATLQQPGVKGLKFGDLAELRLLGAN